MNSVKDILDILEESIKLPFGLFADPKKRVFFLYLITSLVMSYFSFKKFKIKGRFTSYVFGKSMWWNSSAWIDYKMVFFNALVKIIFIGPYLLLGFYLAFHTDQFLLSIFGETDLQLPVWAMILLYTLSLTILNDLSTFLVHYAFHYIPFLWEFHKVHHSATSLNPMTQYRLHPIELIANNAKSILIFGLVTGLFDHLAGHRIDPLAFLGVNIFSFIFLAFGANLRHSHIKFTYINALEYIFISPFQHQIHHSNDHAHFNKNMGSKLAIWDWMFNTLVRSKEVENLTFGLGDEDHQYNSFWKNIFVPFTKTYKMILNKINLNKNN